MSNNAEIEDVSFSPLSGAEDVADADGHDEVERLLKQINLPQRRSGVRRQIGIDQKRIILQVAGLLSSEGRSLDPLLKKADISDSYISMYRQQVDGSFLSADEQKELHELLARYSPAAFTEGRRRMFSDEQKQAILRIMYLQKKDGGDNKSFIDFRKQHRIRDNVIIRWMQTFGRQSTPFLDVSALGDERREESPEGDEGTHETDAFASYTSSDAFEGDHTEEAAESTHPKSDEVSELKELVASIVRKNEALTDMLAERRDAHIGHHIESVRAHPSLQNVLRITVDVSVPQSTGTSRLQQESDSAHGASVVHPSEQLEQEKDDVSEKTVHTIAGHEMFFASRKMEELWKEVELLAQHDMSVLIQAERGTGKELVASALHMHSSERNEHPFVAINCAALPESLLESELFGHIKGAFTGAHKDKDGYFTTVEHGTLFLDEIGEMPLSLQAKLLRVLEGGGYRRVGETNGVMYASCRVVAATNKDLQKLCREEKFMPDLLDRFDYSIGIPPLRARADRQELAMYFLSNMEPQVALSPEALEALRSYSFPGNVRELLKILRNAHTLAAAAGSAITLEHIKRFQRYAE